MSKEVQSWWTRPMFPVVDVALGIIKFDLKPKFSNLAENFEDAWLREVFKMVKTTWSSVHSTVETLAPFLKVQGDHSACMVCCYETRRLHHLHSIRDAWWMTYMNRVQVAHAANSNWDTAIGYRRWVNKSLFVVIYKTVDAHWEKG